MPEMSQQDKEKLLSAFPVSSRPASSYSRFLCVLYGRSGTGKSSCAATARRPILWHSFDPGGTESELVKPHVVYDAASLGGDKYILVNNSFEFDDPTNPTAMLKWAEEFQRLKRLKAFDFFATLVVDSLTAMADANMYQHLKLVGRDIPIVLPKWGSTNDYADASNKLKRALLEIMSVNIDLVLTGHPDMTADELNDKKSRSSLDLPGAMKRLIPQKASEYYLTEANTTNGITEYLLRTKPDGNIDAKSRKSSALKSTERPNLLEIMKKTGYNFEHKPY